jgi:hypothetical protein
MSATPDTDTTALLARIRASRNALEIAANSLSDEQLVAPGPDGWSAKDHLAHVAAWEDCLLGYLNGRGAGQTFGLPDGELGTDAVNAILHRRYADLTASEAREKFAVSHAAVMAGLEALTDADIARPLASYLPDRDDDTARQPVLGWIVGNTCEHYDEHRGWILALTHS